MAYKNKIALLSFCLLLGCNSTDLPRMSNGSGNISSVHINTHPHNWKNPEIVTLLKKGKVVSMRPMKDHLQSCGKTIEFDGEVYLVELDNGLKAVFKAIPPEHLGDACGEVAAYKASVVLGFPHIPPVIMTTIKDMKGSLQLFVETDIDPLTPGVYEAALKEASADDVANLNLFYFVFGQWDTGPHNMLILKDKNKTHLIGIDNSAVCNPQHVIYGELPFVQLQCSSKLQTNDWDKSFPFDQAQVIKKPTTKKVRNLFGNKFPESFYQNFKFYGPVFRYVVYHNCLWKQFHAGDDDFIISFTNHLPDQTRERLKSLNLAVLKDIFACAKKGDFPTPAHLQAILERRDQVLNYFKSSERP